MQVISPGEHFDIELSNGMRVDVVALDFFQEQQVTKCEDDGRDFQNVSDVWEITAKAVRLALPHMDSERVDALMRKLNLSLAQELVKKILHHQSLSEDDKKKPESPQ